MKKKATIVSVIIGILAVAAIIVFSAYRSSESYRKAKAAIQWDCSVTCTEESTSAKYVITYSDVKVLSKTGTLTIQNKNDFDIVVHLLCEGEQEVVSDNIPANSFYSLWRAIITHNFMVFKLGFIADFIILYCLSKR